MSFALSKIVWVLVTPSNLVTLGTAALTLLALWTDFGVLRKLAALAALATLLVVVLPLGDWLARPLEDRFALPTLPARIDGVIVLGGAQDAAIEAARGRLAVDEHAERLIEGLGLALRHPEARLVFSGGSAAINPGEANERRVNERFLRILEADQAHVLYEDRSRNTWENARYTKDLVAPRLGEVWVLVTSAVHMPRSVGIFRRVGFGVIPYPVDYRTGAGTAWAVYFNAAGRLTRLDEAVREYIGLVAYRLMGRTDALFPKPVAPRAQTSANPSDKN